MQSGDENKWKVVTTQAIESKHPNRQCFNLTRCTWFFYHELCILLALIDYPVIHIYISVHMYLLISLDAKYYMYKQNQNLHVKHFILSNGTNEQFVLHLVGNKRYL